jgi:hypothetical protein
VLGEPTESGDEGVEVFSRLKGADGEDEALGKLPSVTNMITQRF